MGHEKQGEAQGLGGFSLWQLLTGRLFDRHHGPFLSPLSVLLCSHPQSGPLLGTVGSFDWAGGAFLYTPENKATFINTTRVDSDMNDAYLGK